MEDSTDVRGHVVVGRYLLDCLKKKKEGDEVNYQWIITQLKVYDMTDVVMLRWLTVLRKYITLLDDVLIVKAVLSFKWAQYNDAVVNMYIDYICDLTSVYPHHLNTVLNALITYGLCPDHVMDSIYINIHKAIISQLQLIPKASSCLVRTLESLAPYKTRPAKYQETFVLCCLNVCKYYSNLSNEILHLVILKMLQIDVEVHLLLLEDTIKTDTDQFPIDMDSDDCTSDVDGTSLKPCFCLHDNMEDKMADSIDVMMCIVFQFIEEICFCKGQLILDTTCCLFKSFIKIFYEQIYVTQGSSYVQFLIFKLTSFEQNFLNYFMDMLWTKFQDISAPALLRQVIAGYISSFMTRANFIPIRTVMYYLNIMMTWIHEYLEVRSEDPLRADVTRHSVWYALCQSIFYSVVYHHKTLILMENGHTFLRGLNFERVISSKLNPLKICLSSIVEPFASVTNKYEIVFCYTIIEENKRNLLPTVATPTRTNVVLECIFPFDPYHLKRSSRYITELYNYNTIDQLVNEEEEKKEYDDDLLPLSFESSLKSLSLT